MQRLKTQKEYINKSKMITNLKMTEGIFKNKKEIKSPIISRDVLISDIRILFYFFNRRSH